MGRRGPAGRVRRVAGGRAGGLLEGRVRARVVEELVGMKGRLEGDKELATILLKV